MSIWIFNSDVGFCNILYSKLDIKKIIITLNM